MESESETKQKDDNDKINSKCEKDNIDSFFDAGGAEPKAVGEIRGWLELREQIKGDLADVEKQKAPKSQVNQLLILRNFATLQIKGLGCITASEQIA